MDDKKANDGLRKLQKAEDAKKALAEYHAAAAAVDANTERLRALRLAKEAAEAAAAPAKAVKKKAGARKAGAQEKAKSNASLAQWLQDQKNSGHRS
jgi:hypothetical protein